MARAGLAGRSDLPQSIGRALASLGSASVALPQPARAEVEEPGPAVAVGQAASESAADSGSSQISELVRRIDKYQSTRGQPAAPRAPRAAFLFDTGPDGLIHWMDGLTRGAGSGPENAEGGI